MEMSYQKFFELDQSNSTYIHPDKLFVDSPKMFTFYIDPQGNLGGNSTMGYSHGQIMGNKAYDPHYGLGRVGKIGKDTIISIWEPGRQVLKNGTSIWLSDRLPQLKKAISQLKTHPRLKIKIDDNTLVALSHDKKITVGELENYSPVSKNDVGSSTVAPDHLVSPVVKNLMPKKETPGYGSDFKGKRYQDDVDGKRVYWGDSYENSSIGKSNL